MPSLLNNVTFDTARSPFTISTGVTGKPLTNLTNQVGHLSQLTMNEYIFLPEGGAVTTTFMLTVDDTVDIALYDRVTNIRQADGLTQWLGAAPNEFWSVTFLHHMPPGVLTRKDCIISRVTGGGPSS